MKNKSNRRSSMFYGWWIVLSVFGILFLSYGIRYSFGVYLKPLSKEFGSSRAMISGVFSIYMLGYAASSVMMGKLTDRYTPRIIIAIGILLMSLGVIISAKSTALRHLYISYGLLASLGAGAIYVPCMAAVARFFVKKRGLALGISTAGIGLGSFIMPPLSQYFISLYSWRTAFVLTGFILLLVGIPLATVLIRRDPEQLGLTPDGEEVKIEADSLVVMKRRDMSKGYTLREAVGAQPFWMFFAMKVFAIFGMYGVLIHLVAYLTDAGISSMVAATALGGIALFSIIGRVGLGNLGDRMGRREVQFLILVGLIAGTLWLMRIRSESTLYGFVILYGIAYGGSAPNSAGLIAELMGARSLATGLGFATLSAGIGATSGTWIAGYVFDKTGSYHMALLMAIGFLCLACVCNFYIGPLKKK
jgi:MFS family permease